MGRTSSFTTKPSTYQWSPFQFTPHPDRCFVWVYCPSLAEGDEFLSAVERFKRNYAQYLDDKNSDNIISAPFDYLNKLIETNIRKKAGNEHFIQGRNQHAVVLVCNCDEESLKTLKTKKWPHHVTHLLSAATLYDYSKNEKNVALLILLSSDNLEHQEIIQFPPLSASHRARSREVSSGSNSDPTLTPESNLALTPTHSELLKKSPEQLAFSDEEPKKKGCCLML